MLADFMAEHSDLARKKLVNCPRARAVSQRLWEELNTKLNSAGPPVKSVTLWRKVSIFTRNPNKCCRTHIFIFTQVFADQKHSVKKKLSFNKFSKTKTGGGPYEEKVLTAAEEMISEASGLSTAVEGLEKVKSFGSTSAADEAYEDVMLLEDEEIENVSNVVEESARRKGRKQRSDEKCSILKENISATQKWRGEKSEKIDRLIELQEKSNSYQKEQLRKLNKVIRLKEKSLKLKEAEHQINMEVKKMDLEIKTLELEVLKQKMQDI